VGHWPNESCFRQVHFGSHRLHPPGITLVFEQTHRRRVASKRPIRKRVNLKATYSNHSIVRPSAYRDVLTTATEGRAVFVPEPPTLILALLVLTGAVPYRKTGGMSQAGGRHGC
jgi:hypothetical protein